MTPKQVVTQETVEGREAVRAMSDERACQTREKDKKSERQTSLF
jgi:hypothetical protein